jgi:hypothetical protein
MTATTPSTRCWSEDVLLYFFRNKVKTYSELISFPEPDYGSVWHTCGFGCGSSDCGCASEADSLLNLNLFWENV